MLNANPHESDFESNPPQSSLQDLGRAEETENFPVEIPSEKRILLDSTAATFLINAKTLMKHQEHGLALNLLRQAANRASHHPEVLKCLALTLEKLEKWEEAFRAYKVLSHKFNNFEYSFKMGQMQYFLGNDEKAQGLYFEALSHLVEENEHLFELYKNLGNIFVRQGDFDGAEEFYNKAYTINPRSDVLLVNFGTLEVQREDFDKALFCFRQAVELNKANDKSWVGLALVHNHFSDSELAWGNLIKALDINAYNRTALILLFHWGQSPDRWGQVEERLRIYVDRFSFDEEISVLLSQMYQLLKKEELSALELMKLRLWNPENKEIKSALESNQ